MSELTREERLSRNTCSLCAGWLVEGSDERLLALDYVEFIAVSRLYPVAPSAFRGKSARGRARRARARKSKRAQSVR
jgi:hypothetical protein